MAQFDWLIKNGTIIDGLRMPRFRGDIGVANGVVAAIGHLDASAADQVIDATDQIVAPGFVDLHTHYDAQIFWDPWCTISGWHGVTSVAIGNCGFGFAPVAPELRDRSMLTMTRNEAISLAAMREGMPWDWITFPEFLDSLERTPKAVNLLPFMPLTPLLVWVMGLERAKAGERPTASETAEMCRLFEEAMDVGACGFSMQRLLPDSGSDIQRDYDGTPMVTDVMHHETCIELARILGRRNEGFIQMTLYSEDRKRDLREYEELAEVSGRPVLFNNLVMVEGMPEAHRSTIDWIESCRKRGHRVYPQAVTNASGFSYSLDQDFNLFDNYPDWRDCMVGTSEERLAKFSDPSLREVLREQKNFSGIDSIENAVITGPKSETTKPFQDMTLGQVAEMQGKPVIDTMLDIVVADELLTEFYIQGANTAPPEYLCEVANYPWAIPGVSDGGAHTKFFTGGTYPTEFITTCARDNDFISLEEAHWKLSTLPAMAAGFKHRGFIQEGAPADIIVYDLANLGMQPLEVLHDLPGGDWRRVRRATGYKAVMVNGHVTILDDEPVADANSGALLRHGGS
ncbi:amidohydrolase family protein [Myxococcota bacterium]|nr:amidohydrolase family protein [Myxococcota bacterium]